MAENPNVQAPDEKIEQLPLARIRESSTNQRRVFEPGAMAELTESIRNDGVIQPVIVRQLKGKHAGWYELSAGARRFRASKAAGRHLIPAIVRDMTDARALETQLIENIQRANLHPMEEADGFAALLLQNDGSIEAVSLKTGFPAKHITRRITLKSLVPELQKDFLDGRIQIGHADRLARLQGPQQTIARKQFLYARDSQFRPGSGRIETETAVCVSVSLLDELIRDEFFLDLTNAPRKKDDATLVAKAGACTTCQKRSGANAMLFDDMAKSEQCLDGTCYGRKAEAHLVRIETEAKGPGAPLARLSSEWSPGTKVKAIGRNAYEVIEKNTRKCGHIQKAVFVDGPRRSQVVEVCAHPRCTVHRSYVPSSSSRGEGPKKDYWAERAKELAERIDAASRRALLKAVCASSSKLKWNVPADQLRTIALALVPGSSIDVKLADCLGFDVGKPKNGMDFSRSLKAAIKNGAITAHLPQLIIGLSLEPLAGDFLWKDVDIRKEIPRVAAAFGIDFGKISKELEKTMSAEFNAKRAAATARKKAEAKKAAKKAPAGKRPAKKAPRKKAAK